MRLEFKIDDKYVVVHALRSYKKPFREFGRLKDRLWMRDKSIFYFLSCSPELFLVKKPKDIANTARKSEKILKELMNTKEVKRLLKETKEYLKFVKMQWKKNEKFVVKTIQELSGLNVPKTKVIVYITHPKLNNGIYIEKNIICWGHPEEWKNYTTVYLAHEILHMMTEEKIDSPIMHSLIELLADNELRIRLNKKGKYLEIEGHDNKLNKRILPIWKDYLKNRKQRNILELEESIKSRSPDCI